MQRVYLLLRKNQQTGPFTIGELLQQSIGPDDMIWIEGESMSWTPLSELELRTWIPTGPLDHGAKAVEKNAEESRPGASNKSQPRIYVDKPGEPAPSFAYNDEDAIVIVDHRKERRNMLREVLMTLTVVALFGLGIYGSRTLIASRKQVVAAAPTKITSTDEHAAKPVLMDTPSVNLTPNAVNDTIARYISTPPATAAARKPAVKSNTDSAGNLSTPPSPTVEPPLANVNEAKTSTNMPPKVQDEIAVPKKEKKEITAEPKEDRQDENASPEPEKKKGFLRKLFGKKKKDDGEKD